VTARRRASGFTLIEIIVVVAIIAVAAAVALPSINAGAQQREIRRTLQGFVSTVRRASSVAVFHRRPVELRILAKDGAYSVIVPSSSADEQAGAAAPEEARPRRSSRLFGRSSEDAVSSDPKEHRIALPALASFGEIDGGRDLGDEGVVFDFYPNGSSSGGTIELRFDVGRGRPLSHKLSINPLVSSISMEDEN
jgi:prepilin-type N-terminal cleavage/methylation domain-containing protein